MQGDIFMREAKQMIWPHCWRRAASVSKSHKPLRHDKSSQPRDMSMPGFWTCSPECSFPLLAVGTHSAGLQHPTTSAFCFPFPGLTCLLALLPQDINKTQSFPLGEVKSLPSLSFSDLQVHILCSLLKDSDLPQEWKDEWWDLKCVLLNCLP